MSTDERLDRLTERHEALTRHIELLTADVMQMRGTMNEMMTGIGSLLHVAETHERRIERLEGQGS